MRKIVIAICLVVCGLRISRAELETPGGLPVEINATGETTYENGIATARDNVAIHFGESDVYADFAQYNSEKREVLLEGRVRIYRTTKTGTTLYVGDRAIYNVDTKEIHATDMRSEYPPHFVGGEKITTNGDKEYFVEHGTLTTHDSSEPDFHLQARTVRVYQGDRIILRDVTFYVGKLPIFYFPYLYQSLDDTFSFSVLPAYLSSWGPTLLTQVTFPLTDNISERVRLDYRTRRGPALGFDTDIRYGKNNNDRAQIRTYFIEDQNPSLNQTSIDRGNVPTTRYRLSLQDRTNFTDDIFGIASITKLSDAFVLEDFFQDEFRVNPQPDNVLAVTKTNPFYTLTAVGRFQANAFFETTERLPEVAIDIKRHALFGGPIFYEGETSVAKLRRNFASGSPFQDYETLRLDSFHQFLYPKTYFGWLSIVPRIGFRGTYYADTRDLSNTIIAPNLNPLTPEFPLPDPTTDPKLGAPLKYGDGAFRTVFNAGVEGSFKFSREWEGVQSRVLGLDGLRHIVQPFTNFSYVSDPGVDPATILQFDRYQPSTQLRPIDFPQYTSIDSIDRWTVWRVGVRNRLQTRRDDLTVSWLELETYVDVNIVNPFDKTQYSNLFNRLRFTPVPWANLTIDSQLPVFDKGFTEINTAVNFQPVKNFSFGIGHRFLKDNPFFNDSSLYTLGAYYRINEQWGFGLTERYEATTSILEEQRYSVYRDLTSWVASAGAVIRNNAGVKEYAFLVTFTLKAFPKFAFDFNFDPTSSADPNSQTGTFGPGPR
jgi:lipopolysaccharide export system protein LptA